MNTYIKLAAAAVAVLVVAVVGYQLLPRSGGVGGPGPSPTPSLLASGTFVVVGHNVVLDATGAGSSVSGTMRVVSPDDGSFTVALACSRTIDGVLWIAGDVTESTSKRNAPLGTRTAIGLKPGSPVEGIFFFQGSDPPSASCPAFIDFKPGGGVQTYPITGTVQLAP
jgi:hypothetical protein